MKKLFSFFIALVTSAGTIFASDTQVDGIWYNFDNSSMTAEVTYRGSDSYSYSNEYTGSVTIPFTVNYNAKTYSVTRIGDWAFSGCTGLTSITIPNSVTSIGIGAFYDCTALTSVHISDLVTWCNISFQDGTANPLHRAHHLYLQENEITNLIIPNSVSNIGNYAFYGCSNLTSITIQACRSGWTA